MNGTETLYKKDNYTIQKSLNIEDKLYTKLKTIVEKEYNATISEVVNACVVDLIKSNNIKYYRKPDNEITIYRSVMLRKDTIAELNKINRETGISVTRLINLAIKEFIDNNKK